MKLKIFFAAAFWVLLFSVACKSDDIDFASTATSLRFSRDTVRLDTVYNQIRSETYAVTVYNNEDKNVTIPQIALQNGNSSLYRINVDGKAGTSFANVPIRKKDSLMIFVEIAPVATTTQALAQDKIVFQTATGSQAVTLLSVVQDAEFFIQSSSNPNIISENTVWTNSKAKIIYGNLTLGENKRLDIQAGTKVYFTKGSSLTISKNAILNIAGDLGNEVILRGDRNDTKYDTIPLNWKGIIAEPGAVLNISYAKIFGGETGIDMNTATLNISNSFVNIFQNYGISAIASSITAKNLIMNTFGMSAINMQKGGTADFTHCTLANYWDFNSSSAANVLYASNDWKNVSGTTEYGPLNLTIRNSILYGDKSDGVILKTSANYITNYLFYSSILKMGSNAGFTFENNPLITNSLKNSDPQFLKKTNYKMNLRVNATSPAKGKGNTSASQLVPQDILKVSRTSSPTIGAYQ